MNCKILIFVFCLISSIAYSNTYYIHPKKGNDKNLGTDECKPWKTFENISKIKFKPGDIISIASGFEVNGSLVLKNQKGSENLPIIINSYKVKRSKSITAVINAKHFLNGILLENCSFIKIENIKIIANGGNKRAFEKKKSMRCGIQVTVSEPAISENIIINKVSISNIFYGNKGITRSAVEVKSANGTQSYGFGIRFISKIPNTSIKNVTVSNSSISNVGHTGIKFTGRKTSYIKNISLFGNTVSETGGPGIQMSNVKGGHVYNNTVNKSGNNDDSRKWGRGSGLWTWTCQDILIEKNKFENANGPGDSAGLHIDYNCKNIIVQYNFSRNNAGGFCEILGNNYNCSYRYNISVNDGYRIKGKNGAFQQGKLFWLSGYVGTNQKQKGPYNSYFYNNTMFVSDTILTKFTVGNSSRGVLIANNIFHIMGKSKSVKGDQYRPEKSGKIIAKNIIFQNNLYLKEDNWPKIIGIQDTNAFYGNAEFKNSGGTLMRDYTPTNINLIKNKGIIITKIPNDKLGLKQGLKVKEDILGNKINGIPDIGAIELN
ncbi:right-handed parallel beta-helix repeat-containing protein [Polaribacter atrinae]|uniref:right-handed parallel beta-helix repeat-containing protein n=1 Tax=Polaribacter atrinae TaxID=1333662 RepID=UPI00248FE513|nr:right-handed parallel beta-helix repeat-containing protein [Polaribacter atrinae]